MCSCVQSASRLLVLMPRVISVPKTIIYLNVCGGFDHNRTTVYFPDGHNESVASVRRGRAHYKNLVLMTRDIPTHRISGFYYELFLQSDR